MRNRTSSFYPGEGDRILNILAEIELYQYNIDETRDLGNSAEASIRILNRILEEDGAIYNQQVMYILLNAIFIFFFDICETFKVFVILYYTRHMFHYQFSSYLRLTLCFSEITSFKTPGSKIIISLDSTVRGCT